MASIWVTKTPLCLHTCAKPNLYTPPFSKNFAFQIIDVWQGSEYTSEGDQYY